MTRSGWCAGPIGALPDHNGCRVAGCDCGCGHPQRDKGKVGEVAPGADAGVRYDLGTNKDGPERGVCTSGRGLADATEERQP